ncbi:MAG: VIT1/CCC1 transporter family protein [Candidatus Hodarchaeales archaeon]
MSFTELDKSVQKHILNNQQDEINSYHIYKKLAKSLKNEHNANIMNQISEDELKHYKFFKDITQRQLKPQGFKIWFYFFILRFFGLTFGIRLMERGEQEAQQMYSKLEDKIPGISSVLEDEKRHEDALVDMLREDLLAYIGSIVLGLSDALVELLGALAGFTFAFSGRSDLIAIAGFITGISAALSMGASEFLSESEEESEKSPLKAAIYTGGAYLITVVFLIAPYLLLSSVEPWVPLMISVTFAVVIIFIFTFYVSVAKNLSFKGRFLRMVTISLGVAFISLLIGLLVNEYFSIAG